MKKYLLQFFIAFILIFQLMPVLHVHASVELCDNFTKAVTTDKAGIFVNRDVVQTWRATDTYLVSSVNLTLYKKGDPGTYLKVSICENSTSDNPNNHTVLDYDTMNPDLITASISGASYEFTFSENITCIKNRYYSLRLEADGINSVNLVYWLGEWNIGFYPNGACWVEDTPNNPVTFTDWDMYFAVYGEKGVPYEPVVITLEDYSVNYNEYTGWTAYVSGNVTDRGNDTCNLFVRYRVNGTENWTIQYIYEYDDTENVFQEDLINLTSGLTYDYQFYISNNYYTGWGDIETLVLEGSGDEPIISTLSYPLYIDTDNLTARVHGKVNYDGGDNVTGYFYYKKTSDSEWLISDNTTDLQTSDDFSANLTGLELYEWYDFQAFGQNINGYDSGSIGQFILYEIETPEITTLPVTNILATYATFNAFVDFDGHAIPIGEGAYCGWRYRVLGTGTWYYATYGDALTGENISEVVSGFNPVSTYEVQAYAKVLSDNWTWLTGYGNIVQFATYQAYTTPTLYTGAAAYLNPGTVSLNGTVLNDGGLSNTIWFEYHASDTETWTDTAYQYLKYSFDEIMAIISGLENNKYYYYRIAGSNDYGVAYGSTRSFIIQTTTTPDDEITGGEDVAPVTTGNWFVDWFNSVEYSWGLNNTLGHWAFMFILMLIVSVIFGILAILANERWIRYILIMFGLILDVVIFGGFLFSGRLGMWAVTILIFTAVGLIVIFAGGLLNRGKQ